MGVDVVLMQVNQPGTSPKRRRLTMVDVVLDSSDLFATVCERSKLPMLSRVDPYRTLILTPAEMPQLVAEVDAELGLATAKTERELLTDIRRLADRCAAEASTELHLAGD